MPICAVAAAPFLHHLRPSHCSCSCSSRPCLEGSSMTKVSEENGAPFAHYFQPPCHKVLGLSLRDNSTQGPAVLKISDAHLQHSFLENLGLLTLVCPGYMGPSQGSPSRTWQAKHFVFQVLWSSGDDLGSPPDPWATA